MRTETIVRNVFQFKELEDPAKETARQWYREGSLDHDWWDHTVEDAKTCAKVLGINIDNVYFSGFWSQGDGACFEGEYGYIKGAVKSIMEHAPQDEELHRIARELQAVQRPAFYQLYAYIKQSGRYSHEFCTDVDVRRDDVGSTLEEQDGLTEVLRDYMRWIYKRLEAEYEYLNSDDTVDDNIVANEYEFEEDGSPA